MNRTTKALIAAVMIVCSTLASAQDEPALALADIAGIDALPDGIRIAEPVQVRDFLAQFEVSNGTGKYLVEGVETLNLRIAEEAALTRLLDLESTPELAERLAKIKHIEPIHDSRTEGMRGRGPARFFRSREDQLVKNLIALQRPMLEKALSERYNPTLRALSERLHIDPYSTHPQLRARLDRLVAAMVEDEALAEALLAAVKAPEAPEIAVDERLWRSSPAVLRSEGIEAMMKMGVAYRASERFFGNPYISPTLALQWLQAQAELGPTPGADAMVMLGVAAESEAEIRMLITQLRWAGAFADRNDPIAAFNVQRQAPTFRTRGNRVVVLLPVEHLSWTKPFAEFAERPDMLGSAKLIWVSGEVSEAAQEGLKANGWSLRKNLELP